MIRTAARAARSSLGMIPRIALLTAFLFAPLIAMQSVQAGSASILEDTHTPTGKAGLVIIASLSR